MELLRKTEIPPPGADESVFRLALWGPVLTFLIFLIGLLAGIALFIYCYQSAVVWGMVLAGLYSLLL